MYSNAIYDAILIEDLPRIKRMIEDREISPDEKDNDYFTYAFFHHKNEIVDYLFTFPSVREKLKKQNEQIYKTMNKKRIQENITSLLEE